MRFTAVFLLPFFLCACQGQNTPQDSVERFVGAKMTGDDATAKALMAPTAQIRYDPAPEEIRDTYRDVRFRKSVIDATGKKARVATRIRFKDGKEEEISFTVVLLENAWLIESWDNHPVGG